ncbi:MAG TPA: pilus assembly protein TadG-related protein, partial [Rhizomicrobium sp.]|nr:pilus assembly protein TadG-related protein [Rhizomicrobium sp.]
MFTLADINAQLRAFATDRRGIAAVYTGVVLVVLAGAAGLGADAVSWELARQKLQGVADQSAYSSVIGVNDGLDGYKNAEAVATQLGYTCSSFGAPNGSGVMSCTGPNGVTLNVNHPAQTGKYANVSDSWEVIVQQTQPMWFTKLFMSTAPIVAGRAVALQQGSGNVCILALDTNSTDIHSIFGNQTGTVTVGGKCQVADNLLNTSPPATDDVDVKSGAILNFAYLSMRDATKCDSGSCQGMLNVANPIQYNQAAIVDPYATRT